MNTHDNSDLATYLNDHLAGSVAALSLIDDLIAGDIDASLQSFLTTLRAEIEGEQAALRTIMAARGMKEATAKQSVAWIIEKVSSLKLGGKTRSGDFPVLQSLEVLYLGITGKLLGWSVLAAILGPRMEECDIDFAALCCRATAQRDEIEVHRLNHALRAFSCHSSTGTVPS